MIEDSEMSDAIVDFQQIQTRQRAEGAFTLHEPCFRVFALSPNDAGGSHVSYAPLCRIGVLCLDVQTALVLNTVPQLSGTLYLDEGDLFDMLTNTFTLS